MEKEHVIEVIGDSYALSILESIIGEHGERFETIERLKDGRFKTTIKI